MSSVKRKCFSIEEKNAILHRLEAGESNVALAKEFGVSHSTISTIKKNKDKIENLFNANVLKCKRVRPSTQAQVDRALLQWVKLQRNQGIHVKGPLLQEKANFFARQLNIPNFNCTMSWISRFKVRYNIVASKIADKSLSVKQSYVSESDVATLKEQSDESIVQNIITNDDANSQGREGNDNKPGESHFTITASEALKAAETLDAFIQINFDDDLMKDLMSHVHNAVRSFYYETKMGHKETNITNFPS